MNNTRIITYIRDGVLADALYENGHMAELSLSREDQRSILGNVYIGKVKNIVKNIGAAFVEIADGLLCYLPLEDVKAPIYTKPKKQERLVEGDELLVQVNREAVKTKAPSVTTNISLNGKYLVLTTGNPKVGYSAKLKAEEKTQLKEIVEQWKLPDAGLIVRTNAAQADKVMLTQEYKKLLNEFRYLTEQAIHRAVFSCVKKSRSSYLNSILGTRSEQLQEILTDSPEIYQEILDFMKEEMPEDAGKLRFYEDRMLPLAALYRMEKEMTEALSTKVWLKSGAYLVIEPTEALTVIDVNTGKYSQGKNKQETFWKINQEAAREISRQLRLRNLSGIVLVDFVDMDTKDKDEKLLSMMREQLKSDPLKTTALDMTELGLMELTRHKQKKTLQEQAKECGI